MVSKNNKQKQTWPSNATDAKNPYSKCKFLALNQGDPPKPTRLTLKSHPQFLKDFCPSPSKMALKLSHISKF